jgi:hypothetical protein
MTEEDRLEVLRSSYKQLQESASQSLSKALDESSKVYSSVLTESKPPEVKVVKKLKLKEVSIMDEFITDPSVPLNEENSFVDLVSMLMEPVHPKSPEFGSTYYARDN